MVTLVDGITFATIVGVLALYVNWLSGVEKLRERETRIRDAVKGELYSRGGIEFEVIRITFQEEGSKIYRVRKYIPYIRRLDGYVEVTLRTNTTNVTLRADGIGFGDYFWDRQSIGDFLGSDYPTVKHLQTDATGGGTETKLRVHSLELTPLQQSLEKVPSYLKGIIDEYPGHAEIITSEEGQPPFRNS